MRKSVFFYLADLSRSLQQTALKSLQRLIPNLTHYRFKIAKQHLLLHGRGCSVPRLTQTRIYVSPKMVDHFICFITSQHIVQDLLFGQKHLSLSLKSSFGSTKCYQNTDSGAYSTTIPRVLQGIRHNLLEPKIFASNS